MTQNDQQAYEFATDPLGNGVNNIYNTILKRMALRASVVTIADLTKGQVL
jgi:hypothetical protein